MASAAETHNGLSQEPLLEEFAVSSTAREDQIAAEAALQKSWKSANKGYSVGYGVFPELKADNDQGSAVLTATGGAWRTADVHGMAAHLDAFSSPVHSLQLDVANAFGEFDIEEDEPTAEYTPPEVEEEIHYAAPAAPSL